MKLLCLATLLSFIIQDQPLSTEQVQSSSNDIANSTQSQQVFVAGTRDPEWKSYRAFVAGMKIFEQRKSLAPLAPLLFVVHGQKSESNLSSVLIRIAGDQTSTTIKVADNGSFSLPLLPEAIDDNAELILNRKKGSYRWRPDIRTPGIPGHTRRLGDLRLECEVRWEIEQHELPYLMKKVFNAHGGPCHNKQIQADFLSSEKIISIQLVDKNRREDLAPSRIENNGKVFYPPVHDVSWSDETLLEFSYDQENQ